MAEPAVFASMRGAWTQHVPRVLFRTVHGGAADHLGRQLRVFRAKEASHEPLGFAMVPTQGRQLRTSSLVRHLLPRPTAFRARPRPRARAFHRGQVLGMRQVRQHATEHVVRQGRDGRHSTSHTDTTTLSMGPR
eukprot:scaffold1927_cov333-Pavlova_lutheri.AAC.8